MVDPVKANKAAEQLGTELGKSVARLLVLWRGPFLEANVGDVVECAPHCTNLHCVPPSSFAIRRNARSAWDVVLVGWGAA
jgi:hypothetical protein